MIDYSVSARPNPREKNTPPRYYASPQVSDNVSMNEFCRHIASHGSVYSRADVQSVLSQAVDCLREMLLDGKQVSLGDLGSFRIGLSSMGTATPEDFNPLHHIKSVHVNWSPGIEFLTLQGSTEWNLVANRRAQRLLLKAIANGDSTVNLSKENETEEGDEGGMDA